MSKTQPQKLFEMTSKDVRRYKKDVESWKRDHGALQQDCWIWEELIAKANYIYERIENLDMHVRQADRELGDEIPDSLYEDVDRLVKSWLEMTLQLRPHGERLQAEYGKAEGFEQLLANIKAAQFSLTSDGEFFDREKFHQFRDEAVADYRAGRDMEPMNDQAFAE